MQVKIHLSWLRKFPLGGFLAFFALFFCEIMGFSFTNGTQRKVNKPTFQSYCNIVRAVAIGMMGAFWNSESSYVLSSFVFYKMKQFGAENDVP